jgi:biotin transport system substrate-specific component
MTVTTLQRRPVLADLVPGGLVRDALAIASAAALTGIAAQIAIPLPFTPVPITLQTLTVLLAGAALGPVRAVMTMALYLVVGMAGVPWFSDGSSGWAIPTLGYVLGFLFAAPVVGALARRGADRSVVGTVGTMILGNAIIYAVGVPYLAAAIGIGLPRAIELGALPFLVGDALKILLAAGLLPTLWYAASRRGG